MSEDSKTNKVTAVEKSEKVKDPRKVELGKKLAKISREAKERKARQRESERRELEADRSFRKEIYGYVDFRYFVGGVTIVTALGGLYYAYRQDKRLERSESKREQIDKSETKDQDQNNQKQRSEQENEMIKKSSAEPPFGCLENL